MHRGPHPARLQTVLTRIPLDRCVLGMWVFLILTVNKIGTYIDYKMMSKKLLLFKIIVIIGSNNLKSVLSVLYSCMDMGYGIVDTQLIFFF